MSEEIKKSGRGRTESRTLVPRRNPDGTVSIRYDLGGETPAALSGLYSSHVAAMEAIQRYLNTRG